MSNYDQLKKVLNEIFELDKADLDFGIYRIMNQKRKQVNEFIDKQLPADIQKALSETQTSDKAELESELKSLKKNLENAGVVAEETPKYKSLNDKLSLLDTTEALEQEVFSHLANFFRRYYKDGDFISMRRYKKDVYAIPYEGEEVKLHWANHDQYYIKSSENFKNYSFKLADGSKVTFQLKEVSTEQNNNKTQGDSERRFALFEELPVEVTNGELLLNFVYEPFPKATKQDALLATAISLLTENVPVEFKGLFALSPTDKNPRRTLLEKHLNDYVSKNSFDYFIHKDLGGFLGRELDFYIKNEVLYLDDINVRQTDFFVAQLSKVKAIKTVATKVIEFLAQIENFQKKLWLKKKFVLRTDYCITLDRIPEKYYAEIFANKEQLAEWKTLFDVDFDVIRNSGKLFNSTLAELVEAERFLVLDTKFFDEAFKDRLLAEFDDLDEQTNGLLINSENFQALGLMQEKYQEKIDVTYIDPPYNTGSDGFNYKDNFNHSSWVSFLSDRVSLSRNLLTECGLFWAQCDENENSRFKLLLDDIFQDNFLNNIAVKMSEASGVKMNHARNRFPKLKEYILLYSMPKFEGFVEVDKYQADEWDRENNIYLEGLSEEDRNILIALEIKEVNDVNDVVLANQILCQIKKVSLSTKTKEIDFQNEDELKDWLFRNSYRIIKTAGSSSLAKLVKSLDYVAEQDIAAALSKNGVLFFYITDFNRETKQPRLQVIFADSNINKNPCDFWQDIKTTGAISDEGGVKLSNGKKPEKLLNRVIKMSSSQGSVVLDYFGGSGTTYAVSIKLQRKFIGIEMGVYFNSHTLLRIKNVLNGDKTGISNDANWIGGGFIKYQVLESYEDTLNNLMLNDVQNQAQLDFSERAQEEYLLHYMLEMESREHLFNLEMFRKPFSYQLKVTENNELRTTNVDLVETFNYLIGLYVSKVQRVKDIKVVEGITRTGIKTLVIWRDMETTTHDDVVTLIRRFYDSARTREFQQIYINGDHHLENLRTDGDQFKIKMIEETFFKKMFNESEL